MADIGLNGPKRSLPALPMGSSLPSVDQQDSLRRFTLALASLSDTEQNLYYFHYYQEVSIRQLADLYGQTLIAINRRLKPIYLTVEQAHLL